MAQLYTFFATFIGVPLVIVGWIWSLVVAKKTSIRWFVAMLFLFVFALPAFALVYWQRIKGPFIVTSIGMLLLLGIIPLIT